MEPAVGRERDRGQGEPTMKDDEQLSTLLEPDVMLPEQFFAGPRRNEERGEHRLMAAILDDAVQTYCMPQVARARAGGGPNARPASGSRAPIGPGSSPSRESVRRSIWTRNASAAASGRGSSGQAGGGAW